MKTFFLKNQNPNWLSGLLVVLFWCILSTGCGQRETIRLDRTVETEQGEGFAEQVSVETETVAGLETVCVYVCGAVKNPGVYELDSDSRIGDAVEAAGGWRKNAAREYWNLAEYVTDGQRIDVPTEAEAEEWKEARATGGELPDGVQVSGAGAPDGAHSQGSIDKGAADGGGSGRININTADRSQLQEIPGIGASRADSIIAYREEHGSFERIEDIMKVSGIKEGLFAKIQEYITV